jgi:hypothetical protein
MALALSLWDGVMVGEAETAFFGLLKTLFILPVFTVPTFPSSQY